MAVSSCKIDKLELKTSAGSDSNHSCCRLDMSAVFSELKTNAGTDSNLAPYMHTPTEILGEIVNFGNVCATDSALEIGCGDGRVLNYFLTQIPSVTVYGIDYDPEAVSDCRRLLGANERQDHVFIFQDNVLTCPDIPWNRITFVYLYLTVSGLAQIWPFLASRLAQNVRVVTLAYKIPGAQHEDAIAVRFIDCRGKEIMFNMYRYRL